jgi:septum formation protein
LSFAATGLCGEIVHNCGRLRLIVSILYKNEEDNMSVLYVASQSPIRHQLLREAQIPFKVITQEIDEEAHGISPVVDERVVQIAQAKMNHVVVPAGTFEGELCWLLTADSLVQGGSGEIVGKPSSREHAVQMLKMLRAHPCRVVTGFCCERRRWDGAQWILEKAHCQAVGASVTVHISDFWIDRYLDKHPYALQTAGVLVVEGYGAQFVQSITGSYTAVMGLPLYELRESLESLAFFA